MTLKMWLLIVLGLSPCLNAQQDGGRPAGEVLPEGLDKGAYIDLAEANWQTLKKTFEERTRKKDPFGAKLDPGTFEELVVKEEVIQKESAVVKVVKKVIPLQSVVNKFQVNGVNAKKQIVMVGFRSLHRGDLVEIKHMGMLFKLRIEKISTNEVVFMNTANQETATVRLGVFKGLSGGAKSGGNPLKKNLIKKDDPLKIE